MRKQNLTFRLIISLFVVLVVFIAVGNDSVVTASQNDPMSNLFLTFEPIEESFKTVEDTTGCSSGFQGVGKFSFDARLENVGKIPVSKIVVIVAELTNGNQLQNADGGPGGVGSRLTVPKEGKYTDGKLSPGEFVDVHFIICLTGFEPFQFNVNLSGKFVIGKFEIIDAPVQKTGQTKSYYTGDDGDLQRGIAWPIPRFTDNGNGTIKDNLTHLIWDKEANRFGKRSWGKSLAACNDLAAADHGNLDDGSVAGDWHLANLRELQSLIHYGVGGPAVPDTKGTVQWHQGDPFNNVRSEDYWTSTNALFTNDVWYVDFYFGIVDFHFIKVFRHFVWCVRGGQ